MKRLILVIFCLLAFPVVASHIVGGEFEIIHISGNTYRINLILYFDENNGAQGAKDPSINARIFRKRDNAVMQDVFLPFQQEEPVSYTQPECSNGEIRTSKRTYTTTVTLSAAQYGDAEGYYISWERCCRNYTITNIFSEDPNFGGRYAGQTFYLEFPPVVKDGAPFINSSPRLFPPLNDYACPNKLFYVDFAGTDDDNDSLVYSLVTPLNTKSGDALPPGGFPRARPYPEVAYRSPFGPGNILGGAPDLRISQDGFLTVVPTSQGLYVFAVRCEEFRNGVKIGEVRRDFQMLVVDRCADAVAPQITGRPLGATTFSNPGTPLSITFANTLTDEQRCVEVRVTDADVFKAADNFQEKIRIRTIPLNFRPRPGQSLPAPISATLTQNESSKVFSICFDKCPYLKTGRYQVGVVAYDDACSLPLSDTLKLDIYVQPPANQRAQFLTQDVTETLPEGVEKSWAIRGIDADNDKLNEQIITDDFELEDAGLSVQTIEKNPGIYTAALLWNAKCDVYDFTNRTDFKITFLLDDEDVCSLNDPDTLVFDLHINLPRNSKPIIGSNLTPIQIQNGIDRKIFQNLKFNVFATDADADNIKLSLVGEDFNPANYNVEFPPASARSLVKSDFNWDLTCTNVDPTRKDDFVFHFIATDEENKCKFLNRDTLTVNVRVAPPDNQKPDVTIANLNAEIPLLNEVQSITVGQKISLSINSTDKDVNPQDNIKLELIEATGNVEPRGYQFTNAEGIGSAHSTFTWEPDCSIFAPPVYDNQYQFKFRTVDDRCFNVKQDTVTLYINISDVVQLAKVFIPANVVTPNDDGFNDFFAMEDVPLNETDQEAYANNLPLDNCTSRFTSIRIYNRWGKEVYRSGQRNFRWYPDQEASGIYFYTVQYTDRQYKGSVTVRY